MTGRRAQMTDGVELWWDRAGAGPAVVLIPGRGDSSDLYPPEFVDALIAAGFSVVRFDPRDTGLSGDGGDAYRFPEMAEDVLVVAAAAGVGDARIHVVGLSMGGMIAVELASRHRTRVASVAFLAAMSPDPEAGVGEAFLDGMNADPVDGTLASMGNPTEADAAWVRAEIARRLRRAPARPDAGLRHQAAAMRLGWPELDALAQIHVPTLVVHGTADRVLPAAHGRALANGIAGADLHLIERMGHLPTPGQWAVIGDLVAAHLRGATA